MIDIRPLIHRLRVSKQRDSSLIAEALESTQSALDKTEKDLNAIPRGTTTTAQALSLPFPADVTGFQIGTANDDGTYALRPSWDQLNQNMVWEWGCFLPADVSNLGGVAVFFRRPTTSWAQSVASADWVTPVPESPYQDAFAINGAQVPRVPEEWVFRCSVADKKGNWKKNPDGSPAGPELRVTTIPPDKGITPGNISDQTLGPGLVKSADQILANIGGVLGFNAGKIEVSLGAGVGEIMGSIYIKIAQGLGLDPYGRIQIPPYSVGDDLLWKGPIIDAERLVTYAVKQMNLDYAPIIDAARIVDLAVLRTKIGLAAVGAAQIADLAVTNAKINDLSVSKLTAGMATFTGDLIIANTGEIRFENGGEVITSQVRAWNGVTVGAAAVMLTQGGVFTVGNVTAGAYSLYTHGGTLGGATMTIPYKGSDGLDHTLYFNGGILTSGA